MTEDEEDELVAELERVMAAGGWQGLADRPDLVERLVVLAPDLPPREARILREMYRHQQTGLDVIVRIPDPE